MINNVTAIQHAEFNLAVISNVHVCAGIMRMQMKM